MPAFYLCVVPAVPDEFESFRFVPKQRGLQQYGVKYSNKGQTARVLPAVLAGIAEEKSNTPLFPMSGGGGHGYK